MIRKAYTVSAAQNQGSNVSCALRSGRKTAGLTLVEVMVAAAVLIFCILGLMQGFLYFSQAGTIAANKARALIEAQSKIEEIRNTDFDSIYSGYGAGAWAEYDLTQASGENADVRAFTGKAFVRIQAVEADLLKAEAVICWESIPGRMVGCEEVAGGIRQSPVMLTTLITRQWFGEDS